MPLPSRREHVSDCKTPLADTHAGLWLDRFLPEQVEQGTSVSGEHPYSTLIKQTSSIAEPPHYRRFFERWKNTLAQIEGVQSRCAEVRGRLIIGIGNESVLETAVTLHRTYGVPYIPGSALKGLAAAYAHQYLADNEWRKPPLQFSKIANGQTPTFTAHEILFGSTRSAGYVTFFDALYVPGSGHKGQALWPDMITVHHPDYYQGKKDDKGHLKPPADWDSPTPIAFINATGSYLVALAGPEQWVTTAFNILALALTELGVGAKTSSGYGRLTPSSVSARCALSDTAEIDPSEQRSVAPQANIEQARVDDFKRHIAQAQKNNLAQYIDRLAQLDVSPSAKRVLADALEARVHELKMKTEGKRWYQQLQSLREVQG